MENLLSIFTRSIGISTQPKFYFRSISGDWLAKAKTFTLQAQMIHYEQIYSLMTNALKIYMLASNSEVNEIGNLTVVNLKLTDSVAKI